MTIHTVLAPGTHFFHFHFHFHKPLVPLHSTSPKPEYCIFTLFQLLPILPVHPDHTAEMAESTSPSGAPPALSATYQSPTNPPFTFSQPLSVPSSETVDSRTKYLKDLGQAVARMQDEVNKELTARMDADKARDAAATTNGRAGRADVDEAKEEENYGEEVMEEED